MKHIFWALLSFSLPLYGQTISARPDQPRASSLPESPSSMMRASETAKVNFLDPRALPEAPPALVIQEPQPMESQKVLNRAFVWLTVMEFSATVADIESTTYALSSNYHEAYPLLGSHPSRAKLYGLGMPSAALIALCSYELKKVSPHSRKWMIPPLLAGSIHGGAAVHNFYIVRH